MALLAVSTPHKLVDYFYLEQNCCALKTIRSEGVVFEAHGQLFHHVIIIFSLTIILS